MVPRVAKVLAPAKINLTLEVTGKRSDGYHDICSVMQAISLADRLTLTLAANDGVSVECNAPELAGPHNLAQRAADLLRLEAGVRRGAHVVLEKRIPVAAGLGGGSADAAATLLGLDALWELGMGRAALQELGARLGSDVPFFLVETGAALAEGRGERLTALPSLPERWLVLLKPPIGIAAKDVYAAFPSDLYSDGSETRAWLADEQRTGRIPTPFNRMESVALRVERSAARARDVLSAAGAGHPVMSGSGSTYFALLESEGEARAVCNRLDPDIGQSFVARLVRHGVRLIEPTEPWIDGLPPSVR